MGKKPDKTPPKQIKLIDLPKTLGSQGLSVTYNQCYMAAVNGTIPASRTLSGARWVVNETDIPSVIENFSLLKDK